MKKPVALIIMDGFGYSEIKEGNAIEVANIPNLKRLEENYPHTLIQASGLDVGLPNGQMGNSEVGHTNIGAGRIVYQDLTRVSKSIEDGDFFTNEVLLEAMENAKKHSLHLMGLLSDGGVHSHIDHLKGLIKMAKQNNVENVYIHAFTDGRDVAPQSALEFIEDIENYMKEVGVGKFASVSGRYYAMDRDKRWERVQLAYEAMAQGKGNIASSAKEAIEKSYADGKNDEFVVPTVIVEDGNPVGVIKENDSIVFGNFRPDRAREITRALVCDEFVGFDRPCMKTFFVCLTTYDITIKNVHVAFKPQSLDNTLGEYLAKNGKTQLRAAETEKYAHVTFFFNGGVEEPNKNEERVLVPSPKVATYDLQPEMSAYEVTEKLVENILKNEQDLIIINYANPDMVGHTGIMSAAIKAVETIDECLGKVLAALEKVNGQMFDCADHGNSDQLVDYSTGQPFTAHTTNPVPFVLVNADAIGLKENGKLCDIAPTLLEMMNLEQPAEMTGQSLLIK